MKTRPISTPCAPPSRTGPNLESAERWRNLAARTLRHVDKYVLDNGQGGSGQRFDWSLLQGQDLRNVMLAGGLGADNCVEAAKSGCAGLDFNSGVESQPGIKDASKLASVFKRCAHIKEQ
jgi:phosphoribosylanthranilate isomerase